MEKHGDITFLDLVRKYVPDATNEIAEIILWEHTAFPMADLGIIETQLKEFAENKNK